MVASSPSPRRVSTPSWLDLRLVLGVALVLVAVLLGATLLSRASDTRPVVAVTRDLAAGTVLRAGDLTVSQVRLPGASTRVYLDRPRAAVGETLDRAVSQGELLPAAALVHGTQLTTVTLPLSAGAAPALRTGQRIEVWLSTTRCASVVLLDDVTVQDVRTDSSASFGNGSSGQDVVVSVTPALAGRVIAAQAISNVQIRAGVLTGSAGPTSGPTSGPTTGAPTTAVPTTDAGGLPSDLADCVPSSG